MTKNEKMKRIGAGLPAGDTKTYMCIHIFEKTRPILYVTRPEGDWCVLCGDDHPQDGSYFRVVGMGHAIEYDPTILEVLDLGKNEEAERTRVGDRWRRSSF